MWQRINFFNYDNLLFFREMLNHELVQGKPILLLCNKSDIDQAQVSIIRMGGRKGGGKGAGNALKTSEGKRKEV